jgi:hypothetical protein
MSNKQRKVYVLFLKDRTSLPEGEYSYLPYYEIHYQPVEGKVAELNPNESVDVYKATLSNDKSYVRMDLYTVSNISGQAKEEFTESFLIDRGTP